MERVLSSTAAGTSAAWQAQQRRQPRAPTGPAAAQVAPPRRGGGAAGRRGLGVRVYAIKPIHVAFQAEVERRGLQTELSPQQQQQLSPSQKDAVGHANKVLWDRPSTRFPPAVNGNGPRPIHNPVFICLACRAVRSTRAALGSPAAEGANVARPAMPFSPAALLPHHAAGYLGRGAS